MPYAFLNPDGTIKQVVVKLTPFMRVGEGERIVNYNPPSADDEVESCEPVFPIEGLDTQFVVTPKDPEVVARVWMRRKSAVVQKVLDDAAQARSYDSILSAVSYAGSGHPIFDPEGTAFRDWRNACWTKVLEILDDVRAGNRPMPTDEELTAELPQLVI